MAKKGVDVVLTYGDVEVVVKSEVEHDTGGKEEYMKRVKRLEKTPSHR